MRWCYRIREGEQYQNGLQWFVEQYPWNAGIVWFWADTDRWCRWHVQVGRYWADWRCSITFGKFSTF